LVLLSGVPSLVVVGSSRIVDVGVDLGVGLTGMCVCR